MSSTPSYPTAIAAALMAMTLGIHLFMGGPEVHEAMLAGLQLPGLRAFASVLWHAVSVNLLVFSVALAALALRPNRALEATLAATQIGFAGLFLAYGAIVLGSVWPMPQWLIFLTIPALTRFGQARRTSAATAQSSANSQPSG